MTHHASVVGTLGMQIQHQVPKGSVRHRLKRALYGVPLTGKRLQQHVPHAQLIPRVLEGHDVVRISGDALGVFAGREHVLTQVEDCDVAMVRVFGEQIQDILIVAALSHEIVQDQDPTSGKPGAQVLYVGYPFVKLHAPFLQATKSRLPCPVTVMQGARGVFEEIQLIQEQARGEDGLPTSRGSHDQYARWRAKTKRLRDVHGV